MIMRQTSLVTLTVAIAISVSFHVADVDSSVTSKAGNSNWIQLAQTQTKENRDARQDDRQDDRDDRQDTRQDCRQAEGAGKDKRDCKQDSREN